MFGDVFVCREMPVYRGNFVISQWWARHVSSILITRSTLVPWDSVGSDEGGLLDYGLVAALGGVGCRLRGGRLRRPGEKWTRSAT